MTKTISSFVRIFLICVLFFTTSQYSQAIPISPLPQVSCTNDEFPIPPLNERTVIEDTTVSLIITATTPVIANNDRCILTFSTEAATSEDDPQLMVLQYEAEIILGSAPSTRVTADTLGPVIAQVRGGIDQTYTFKSLLSLPVPEGNAAIRLNIRPVIQSAFNGRFRLARRCLIVECDTR